MTIYTSRFDDVPLRDQTITQRVFEGLKDRRDTIILTEGPTGRTMTGQAFIDAVQALAGGLTAAGFGAGHTVGLMAPNMPEYAVIFHAVAWAGGTITTLNPSYTAAEVAHQISDSGAEILFTVPSFLDTAQQGAGTMPVIAIGTPEFDALMMSPLLLQVPVDLDAHTVVLPYSSGTTGLPKGVRLSHRNLVVNVDQTLVLSEFQTGEVAAAFLPFFHIYGMNVLMNVHLTAGHLVTMPRFDLDQFLQINQDYKSRRMWVVPPVALALAKHPMVDDFDLSHLEQVLSAAAPCGAELSEAVAERLGCVTVQGYGMTEMSPVSHLIPGSAPRAGASGLTAPNTLCRIVDVDTGANVSAGSEGELWIKGPQVMQGYLNNEKATAEAIVQDGWLRTGDIALIDADGYMFITDRLKELIKYKGFQVAPAELEAVLVALDGIGDAAVIGLADDTAGEVPIAFVVAGGVGRERAPSDAEIHAHFKATLATYKQLHQIHWVDAIPKSASGKILRRVLRDQILNA